MEKPKNATQAIMLHLRNKKTISQLDALKMFGNLRLSAVIFNLKKKGWKVKTEMVEFETRYGLKGRYGRYKLISAPKETPKKK